MCLKFFKNLFKKTSKNEVESNVTNVSDLVEETRTLQIESDVITHYLDGNCSNSYLANYLQYLIDQGKINNNKTFTGFIDKIYWDYDNYHPYTESELFDGEYKLTITPEIEELKSKIVRYKVKVPNELMNLINCTVF